MTKEQLIDELVELRQQVTGPEGMARFGDLPSVAADPTQMRQLLENLIGNALKYHREDVSPVVEVTGELIEEQANNQVRILVRDNGIGFDEKHLDRIFEPFQRLHGRGEYEGSGIGLAICRKIVELHGGAITARSTPGEGTTFIVTLPIEQPTNEDRL
jgi:signal transduction histidine kinase